MMQKPLQRQSPNNDAGTTLWLTALIVSLLYSLAGCKSATTTEEIPLELISIDDAALKIPEVDSKGLATEPLKHMKSAVELTDKCMHFMENRESRKTARKPIKRIVSPLSTNCCSIMAYVVPRFNSTVSTRMHPEPTTLRLAVA